MDLIRRRQFAQLARISPQFSRLAASQKEDGSAKEVEEGRDSAADKPRQVAILSTLGWLLLSSSLRVLHLYVCMYRVCVCVGVHTYV